jgi:hypoxanthine phosphoribosyltransferase
MHKRFIEEQQLLEDSYRLARQVYLDGFRPDFIVGVWRGGSTVGIYLQECLQYLGVQTDHIAVRTSYRGRDDYFRRLREGGEIRVHGLQYLVDRLSADDSLLIVDDVYSTGRNLRAIVDSLQRRCKRNMAGEVRLAVPYYRPIADAPNPAPDYFLQQTDEWLVLPYELTGISREEMAAHKPWIMPLLDELKPGWQ